MGKILEMPSWINSYSFKTGVSIPTNNDDVVVVDATHLDVSNIIVTDIKNFLGSSSTSVGGLCQMPNINQFARFRPDGNPPFRLGDFAGYNHYALPPSSVVGMTTTTGKGYESSTGLFPFTVSLSVIKGERAPDLGETAWNAAATKFTYNGTVSWSSININSSNYASAQFKANVGTEENVTINIKNYYTGGVTSGTSGATLLVGYGDGHTYGKLIEDPNDNKDYSVLLTAVSPTLYCNFNATLDWDGSKKWVSIGTVDPSGYNYTYSEWTAINGSIANTYANYIAVNLVTVGGVPNSGDFSVNITASYSGMISVSKTITISIRNNIKPLD